MPGPNGETVTSESSRGTLTVTLTDGDATRTLLEVGAPDTYTFGQPAWSADGSYVVVKDDLDQVLVITTGDPSRTRLLAGGYDPAVTAEEIAPGP